MGIYELGFLNKKLSGMILQVEVETAKLGCFQQGTPSEARTATVEVACWKIQPL